MRDSQYFLLMASPAAVASPWVQQEITFWKQNRTPDTFLVIVTDGHVAWKPGEEDFDWSKTTALPNQLRGWFAAEPMWVQLDGARRDTELSLRNTEFRAVVCKLAAAIRGMQPDELDSEDIRQYRLASRLRQVAITALILLLAISAMLGVVATRQRDEARRQATIANSRALAGEAEGLAARDPVLAARLSLASYSLAHTVEAKQSLATAMTRNRYVRGYLERTSPRHDDTGLAGTAAVSPNGALVAVGARWTGEVRLWNATSRRPIGLLHPERPSSSDRFGPTLAFSGDNKKLVVRLDVTVEVWDVASRQRISVTNASVNDESAAESVFRQSGAPANPRKIPPTTTSADGRTTISGDDQGRLVLRGDDSREVEQIAALPSVIWDIALSQDGTTGVAVDIEGNVVLLRPHTDGRFDVLPGTEGRSSDGAAEQPVLLPSPDGHWLLVQRLGLVELWQLDERRMHAAFPIDPGPWTPLDPPWVAFSPDSGRFGVRSGGKITVREVGSRNEVGSENANNDPVAIVRAFARALGGAYPVRVSVGTERAAVIAADPGREQELIAGHFTTLAGAQSGRSLAVTAADQKSVEGPSRVSVWSLHGDALERVGEVTVKLRVGQLAVSPDSRFVVVSGGSGLDGQVLGAVTGSLTPLAGGSGQGAGSVFDFVSGGEMVAEDVRPTRDATVASTRLLLWDPASGVLLGDWSERPLAGKTPSDLHAGVVGAGRGSALTVRADGGIAVWDVSPDAWADRLCAVVGDLEPAERQRYLAGLQLGPLCQG